MKFKGYILLGLMMLVTLTGCGSGFEWFPGTPQALTIFTKTLPDAAIGTPYNQTLLATGGKTPYAWTLDSGVLPDGLNLNFYGVISGTPTANTKQTFTVKVTDSSSPNVTATQQLVINMSGAVTTLAISPSSLSAAPTGVPYSQTFTATGGTAPYTFSNLSTASGRGLPYGLNISAAGKLSGTPVGNQGTTAGTGTFNFTVQAKDSSTTQNTATQALSLSVPTIDRMYDPTRVVYAENISSQADTATTTNLLITFGNSDTVNPHNLTVHVGAFNPTSGALLSPDLTVTNNPVIPPASSPAQTHPVKGVFPSAVWRITSVSVAQ